MTRQSINSLSRPFLGAYLANQSPSVLSVVGRVLGGSSGLKSTVELDIDEIPLKTIFYKEDNGNIIAVFPSLLEEKLGFDHVFYQCFTNRSKDYICNEYIEQCCQLATRKEYILVELQLNLLGYVLDTVNEQLERPTNA